MLYDKYLETKNASHSKKGTFNIMEMLISTDLIIQDDNEMLHNEDMEPVKYSFF